MSLRNFARLFHSETGETPARFTERARSEAARCKLEQTVVPIETIHRKTRRQVKTHLPTEDAIGAGPGAVLLEDVTPANPAHSIEILLHATPG